jgi:hypothetical protein
LACLTLRNGLNGNCGKHPSPQEADTKVSKHHVNLQSLKYLEVQRYNATHSKERPSKLR